MPAVLPPSGVDVNVNEDCTICGWGNMAYPDFRPAEQLQCVNLPVLRTETCNGHKGYRGAIHSDIMCIGLMKGGKDSCQVCIVVPLGVNWPLSTVSRVMTSLNLKINHSDLHFEVKKINKIISWLKSHTGESFALFVRWWDWHRLLLDQVSMFLRLRFLTRPKSKF